MLQSRHRSVHSVFHAAAGIEQQTYGYGPVLPREGGNLLLDSVFQNPKLFFREIPDRPIECISDTNGYKDNPDVRADQRGYTSAGRYSLGFTRTYGNSGTELVR